MIMTDKSNPDVPRSTKNYAVRSQMEMEDQCLGRGRTTFSTSLPAGRPLRSHYGALSALGVAPTEDQIDESRRDSLSGPIADGGK